MKERTTAEMLAIEGARRLGAAGDERRGYCGAYGEPKEAREGNGCLKL
jgi:hypothetical protein